MHTFVLSERKLNLFFLRGKYKIYTSGTMSNSQMMPTNINKNGAIVKVRILVEQVIPQCN